MAFGMPRPDPFGIPPMTGGLLDVPKLALPPMAAAVKAKPKFFGKGGAGLTIAGIIADMVAAAGGRQGLYAPTLLKRRELEAEDAREQAKIEREERRDIARTEAAERARLQNRNEGLQDWLWKENWQLQNKPQVQAIDVVDPATGIKTRQFQVIGPRAATPTAPVGRLTPIDGGPAPQAPGGFRRPW